MFSLLLTLIDIMLDFLMSAVGADPSQLKDKCGET